MATEPNSIRPPSVLFCCINSASIGTPLLQSGIECLLQLTDQSDGKLKADVALWSNTHSMQDRSEVTDSRVLYLSDNPSSRVPRTGKVVGWKYYSTASGVLVAQVWRRSDAGLNFFNLIGHTVISPSGDQSAGEVVLEEAEQFDVQAGDCVGFLFLASSTLGTIPFDGCSTEHVANADLNYYNSDSEWALDASSEWKWVSKWRGVTAPYDILDSQELGIEFDQLHIDTKDCRHYSIAVLVK